MSSDQDHIGSFRLGETETDEANHDVLGINRERSDNRQLVSSRKRFFVLLGCSILQLPIWGFAMTYGIFQEYYLDHWSFQGSRSAVGVVGTTSNGVMYLSMPLLFAAFTRRWSAYRRTTAFCGVLLACLGFLVSSFSTNVWHLILTQGILAAFGCVLIYSPTTLVLSEYFSSKNRALAYGAVLSSKNITGSVCPFLIQALLARVGFRNTMRIWTAITAGTSLLGLCLMPLQPPQDDSSVPYRARKISWGFLQHRAIYIYSIAIMLQSSGYGIAQTYLSSYAHSITSLSTTSSTLLLTLFNAPGILSCTFFGFLSDNTRMPLSANTTTFISALASSLAAFLLWGLSSASSHALAVLILFAMVYGFFAGGYSSTWGGVIKEMEREAADRNEAFDTGMVLGLLNGARGIGYVAGGLLGVQLLKAGTQSIVGSFAYGTIYGPVILFTGFSTLCGGWSMLFKCQRLARRL